MIKPTDALSRTRCLIALAAASLLLVACVEELEPPSTTEAPERLVGDELLGEKFAGTPCPQVGSCTGVSESCDGDVVVSCSETKNGCLHEMTFDCANRGARCKINEHGEAACTLPLTTARVETSCIDGLDNDADGLADCADSDCHNEAVCSCANTGCDVGDYCYFGTCYPVVCTSDADCSVSAGSVCLSSGVCGDPCEETTCGAYEVCSGGSCYQVACSAGCENVPGSECNESGLCGAPGSCTDGTDDDFDGDTDCADPECVTSNQCQCSDVGCPPGDLCDVDGSCVDVPCGPIGNECDVVPGTLCNIDTTLCELPEDCDDGVDNDNDGLVDCYDYIGCRGQGDCTEVCEDGVDNTGNGLVDCDDPSCVGSLYCCGVLNCEIGQTCDQGECVQIPCADDPTNCDLSPGSVCKQSGQCGPPGPCSTNNDCALGLICDAGSCVDLCSGVTCGAYELCFQGACYQADCSAGCENIAGSECNESGLCGAPGSCTDGTDDDSDGFTDCSDADCEGTPPCAQ